MLFNLCLLVPLAVLPQDAAAQDGPRVEPLLSMTTGGCESFFVDDKDQRLLAALQLVDERLLELPREIPDFDAPPGALELVMRLFGGPLSLTIGLSSEPIEGMPMPFAGELRLVQASPGAAGELVADVAAFLADMGAPVEEPAAGEAWVMPAPVPLWMGEAGADAYLRLGLEGGVPATDQSHLLPRGARPSFMGSMDYGSFIDFLVDASGSDPEVEQMVELLARLGLEELEYEWAMGSDEERSHLVFNMPGWAQAAAEAGLISEAELEPRIVATIPEDATWAWAFAMDLGAVAETYRSMGSVLSGDPDMDLFALVEESTGLDVERDLIAPFGGLGAVYASDTTGGGGLLSTVAVIELADREAFLGTWGRMEEAAGDFGRDEAQGYLRFSHYRESGYDFSILSFPGLPVPFELCMSTTAQYAVIGVTPQATQGALEQIEVAQRSLLDNVDFQQQLAPDMSGVVSVSWVNTPRLMQDGYGTVALLCSALANGVRSPHGTEREPGVLLPPFHSLRADAKGIVTVGRRVGDDFRSETRADRSQLVNAAGLVGYVYSSPVVALVGVGMMATLVVPQVMGRLQQAEATQEEAFEFEEMGEETPEAAQVQVDILAIYEALEHYAINNGGVYPESLEELVTPDENGASYMAREHLVDPWGDEYLYWPPERDGELPTVELAD